MIDDPVPVQEPMPNGPVPAPELSDEWQRIEAAYKEIQRRDGSAESNAATWRKMAFVLLGLFAVTLGVMLWQFLTHRDVQAFVQVVQVDEQGQLVQSAIPVDLLAYSPPDALWMDMLSQWVQKMRWRGEDGVRARREWQWVYRHTCSQARRILQTTEEREKPFEVKKKLVAIDLKSITKTKAPESYQVLWIETTTDKAFPTVKTQQWTGTFSVGRYRPPSLADALENRLGLCVSAFDISPQP